LSGWFQQMAGVDLLGTKVPLVNKSLGDILGGQPRELALDNAALTSLSGVSTDGAFKKFTAVFSGVDLRKQGVALGDTVVFTDAGGTDREGVVDAVDGGLLTVRFDAAQSFVPNTTAPSLRVRRVGSLGHQVQSFLGNWADPTRVQIDIPTVQ